MYEVFWMFLLECSEGFLLSTIIIIAIGIDCRKRYWLNTIGGYAGNMDIARDELEDNELVIDIVQKPFDIDSLTAKITQYIGS
jgi:hypothetical protein